MLMNGNIIFDCYCCINSAKNCENEENIAALNLKPHHISYAITLLKLCMIRAHSHGPEGSVEN